MKGESRNSLKMMMLKMMMPVRLKKMILLIIKTLLSPCPRCPEGMMVRRKRRPRRAGRKPRSRWEVVNVSVLAVFAQERLKQQAIKEAEKERAEFYAKQKQSQKEERAKYREKVACLNFISSILYHIL